MKIFSDRNILAVEDRFSCHGELRLFDGRVVERSDLMDADVLLVRSITTVDEQLIGGSSIRFVGTATSGIDHIDTDYLNAAGIGFAHAKGSNANAVVEYCFSALAYAVVHHGFRLQHSKVGIIGVGAVGALFAARLRELGVEVHCCDPLLAEEYPERDYCSLNEALDCDVVSVHVPLTRDIPTATLGMIGAKELGRLGDGAVFINACRGLVVDESALEQVLAKRSDLVTVFDVWADEPAINTKLANSVTIATPHIAGYSVQAKLNATDILVRAFEEFFNLQAPPEVNAESVDIEPMLLGFETKAQREWLTLLEAFSIGQLSDQFKAEMDAGATAQAFDSFRKKLLSRCEWSANWLERDNYSDSQQKFLSSLGFRFV